MTDATTKPAVDPTKLEPYDQMLIEIQGVTYTLEFLAEIGAHTDPTGKKRWYCFRELEGQPVPGTNFAGHCFIAGGDFDEKCSLPD